MVTKKPKGLGRGFEALLGPKVHDKEEAGGPVAETGLPSILQLDVMVPGQYQPRTHMDEGALYELAESIKAQGIMQPILVRRLAKGEHAGKYEIIAGERRFRAARIAGLAEVPVLVREVPDEAAAAMALIENIQREDLNPLEEAQSLQRLINEFSLTHAEAAEAVGRSRAAVSNLLRLLELPPAIRALLEARRLEMGHARALLTLSPDLASKLASDAAEQGWSVREVEHRAQQFAAGKVPVNGKKAKPAKAAPQPDIASLETELSESLGTRVTIAHGRGGKGKLIIQYTDLDTLDGVLERLRPKG
ncbi:ParB/RepB/Spo0J family partition protein [Pseudoxanthomonas mexicana]|uniref:ParB/RepB/Spo0J family partition protein n=1 Tax=Pseudoxanthomonas mexicana TaxID=128785 RepID=UPI0024E1EAE6|nr:ParB/RepB/Spo0J family partition protein [Pseudoxanthomonas mexicana]